MCLLMKTDLITDRLIIKNDEMHRKKHCDFLSVLSSYTDLIGNLLSSCVILIVTSIIVLTITLIRSL